MKNLKLRRKALNITQKHLGELVGVSAHEIYRYERGESEPSQAILKALANVLNTTVDYIIDNTDNPNRPGNTETLINNAPVTPREERLIEYFRGMNKRAQNQFEEMAEYMPKK